MALFFHQLIMTSRFNYLAIFHYQDVVCIFNRTQSMCYYENGSILEDFLQIPNDFFFVYCVKRIGSLVKEKIFWIFIYSSGEHDTLFLSHAQPFSILSYYGIESKR